MNSLGPVPLTRLILNCLANPRRALAFRVVTTLRRRPLIYVILISLSTYSGSLILISGVTPLPRNPSISSSSLISFFRSASASLVVLTVVSIFLSYLVGLRTGTSLSEISSSKIFVTVRILSITSCFLNRLKPSSPRRFAFLRRSTTFRCLF